MPGWDRDTPWRQGDTLTNDDAVRIGVVDGPLKNSIVVVISHDCDLAAPPSIEPDVEVIIGRMVDRPDGNLTLAKSPRKLHLPFKGPGGDIWVELSSTAKVKFSKETWTGIKPCRDLSLPRNHRTTLQLWLAVRYRRSAFPDSFNERLSNTSLKETLAKILEPLGEYIRAVFFDVDGGDEVRRNEPEDTYTLDIYLVFDTSGDPDKAETAAREAAEKITNEFKAKLFDGLNWKHIELRCCETMSDEALSYKQSQYLRRWYLDHISLRSDTQTLPAE